MTAAVEVIELISMETEGAIGGKMQCNNAYRSSSEEQQSCGTDTPVAREAIQAKGHPRHGRASSRSHSIRSRQLRAQPPRLTGVIGGGTAHRVLAPQSAPHGEEY